MPGPRTSAGGRCSEIEDYPGKYVVAAAEVDEYDVGSVRGSVIDVIQHYMSKKRKDPRKLLQVESGRPMVIAILLAKQLNRMIYRKCRLTAVYGICAAIVHPSSSLSVKGFPWLPTTR